MAQASADVLMTFAATGQDQVTGAMNKVQSHYEKTSKSVNKTSKSMENQFRLIRGGLGQMGHQVQDIAVQLQMGQNALLVFGQQGSQIASLMGPNGAIIGALLAVGAALGTTFLPALFDSGKAAEELAEKIEQAASKTEMLTQSQLAALAVKFAQDLEEQKEALADQQKELESELNLLDQYNRQLTIVKEGSAKFDQVTESIKEVQDRTTLATGEIEQLNTEISDTEEKLSIIKAGGNPFFDAEAGAKQAKREVQDLYDRVTAIQQATMRPQTEFDLLGADLAADLATLQDALDAGAIAQDQYNQTELARLEQYSNDVIALNDKRFKNIQRLTEDNERMLLQIKKDKEKELTDALKEEQKKREDISKAETSVRMGALNALSSTVGMAASLFKEGTAAQKAAFLAQQALAIATTIINTETASAAALAPPPIGLGPVLGLPYSQVIRGAGYTSAALIGAQTVASFEGGGFTGFGARAGGIDNKGGRLAVLHPNETVLDHTKGQGQGITIINNVDASGGSDVDQKIVAAMEITSQQTVKQVQDLLRRQRLV